MSWNSIADNQLVSFDNLKDGIDTGVFEQVSAPPTGNNITIKPEITTYARINTAWALYANKTSLQAIAKRDLIPLFNCATELTNFQDKATIDLGTTSGNVTITGSGLTTGDTFTIKYPATAAGTVIATTSAVDGSGNLNYTFSFTYSAGDGSNILIEKTGV